MTGFGRGLVICAVIVGALFYRLQNPGNLTDNFVFILGYSLLPALGVYFLLRLIFKSSGHGGLEFVTFMVLLLGISASNYVGVTHGNTESQSEEVSEGAKLVASDNDPWDVVSEEKTAASSVKDTYQEVLDSTVDENGDLKVSDLEIDTTPISSGDTGKIEQFIKEHFKEMLRLQNEYLSSLDGIGFKTILDPARVSEPNSYSESIRILLQGKSLLKESKQRFRELQNSVPDSIKKLDISQKAKEEFLIGFEKSRQQVSTRNDELFRLEEMILSETEAAIDVLENSRGGWSNKDGQFIFEDDAVLNAYNSHIINAMNYYDRQKKLKTESDKAVLESFERMEKSK